MSIKDSLKASAASRAKAVQETTAAGAIVVRDAAAAQARVVMSDMWHAVRTDRQVQMMLALLIVSLICWGLPVVSVIFYPFKILVSMIGQACAVLVARITGGTVNALVIDPAGGVSAFKGGNSFLIANAGALGTAIVGGFLIWWGRTPREARFALRSLGTALLVLALFYANGNLLVMTTLALTTLAILLVSVKASEKVCHITLLVLAVQTTLSALISIPSMLLASTSGDALTANSMQELTGVPALVWALLWGLVSLAILIFSFWFSYKPSPSARSSPSNAHSTPGGVSAAALPSASESLPAVSAACDDKSLSTPESVVDSDDKDLNAVPASSEETN